MPEENNISAGTFSTEGAERTLPTNEEIETFGKSKPFNVGIFMLWIAAVLSILGTAYFYLLQKDSSSKLQAKKDELAQIDTQLQSAAYTAVEQKATDFKSSVTALKSATTAKKYQMNDLLIQVYTHTNKNIIVSSLSITDQGKISFSGTTDSYRSAADQLVTFREWKSGTKTVLTDLSLGSVSEKINTNGKAQVSFVITGTINKSSDFKLTPAK